MIKNQKKNIYSNKHRLASFCKQQRIVLLGSTGVGKTSLTTRWCYDEMSDQTVSTIFADEHGKDVRLKQSNVSVSILDVSAIRHDDDDDLAMMTEHYSYIRKGEAFMCVFSIVDSNSFQIMDKLRY